MKAIIQFAQSEFIKCQTVPTRQSDGTALRQFSQLYSEINGLLLANQANENQCMELYKKILTKLPAISQATEYTPWFGDTTRSEFGKILMIALANITTEFQRMQRMVDVEAKQEKDNREKKEREQLELKSKEEQLKSTQQQKSFDEQLQESTLFKSLNKQFEETKKEKEETEKKLQDMQNSLKKLTTLQLKGVPMQAIEYINKALEATGEKIQTPTFDTLPIGIRLTKIPSKNEKQLYETWKKENPDQYEQSKIESAISDWRLFTIHSLMEFSKIHSTANLTSPIQPVASGEEIKKAHKLVAIILKNPLLPRDSVQELIDSAVGSKNPELKKIMEKCKAANYSDEMPKMPNATAYWDLVGFAYNEATKDSNSKHYLLSNAKILTFISEQKEAAKTASTQKKTSTYQ